MSDERTRYISLAERENDAEPIEGLLFQFEIDLNVLVKLDHQLTIEGIGKLSNQRRQLNVSLGRSAAPVSVEFFEDLELPETP